ncbi:hypothetical protein AB0M43_26230 [Longispora sp. NPDC051575]|uniref:hypothetical protein n=1 Tax=Longispora sp. NPDC051575 TaxID=3154943 RepID=UPI00342AE577
MGSSLESRTGGIAVDLSTFDGLIKKLDEINRYVKEDLLKQALNRIGEAEKGGGPGGAGAATPVFGSSEQGRDISGRVSSARTAAAQELGTLQQEIERLVSVTKKIQEDYKTLEEKNTADVKKIEALFEAPMAPPTGQPPGYNPVSNPTQQPPTYGNG